MSTHALHHWRRVAVACLVVLAGCGGLSATGTPAPATETGTAVVDSHTPTPEAVFPPGVTRSGVDDPEALATAHGSTLSTAAYTTNHTTTVTFENGTVYAATTRTATVADDRRYLATVTQRGARTPVGFAQRVSYYADGESLRRQVVGWNGTATVQPREESPRDALARLGVADDDRVYQLLSSATTTAVSAADGDGALVIELTGASPAAPSFVTDASLATATLTVTGEGVVTDLTVTYDATVDGEPVTVETSVRYTVDGASVDPPEWAANDA